jgi:hypothetical protein
MGALVKLRDKWLHSSLSERLAIVQNIWNEIEAFGDIYRMDLEGDDNGPGTDEPHP